MAQDADQRVAARRLAMDLLARREHSAQELKHKLTRRDFPVDIIETVLTALRADGLQDDRRFVEAFVRSRVTRGKGPLKIMAELGERGVDAAEVDDAIAASGADWVGLATEALVKRFGDVPTQDFKDRARRLRFLSQRGFTRDQSQAAVAQSDVANAQILSEQV